MRDLKSTIQSKNLAAELFEALCDENRTVVVLEDFLPFFQSKNEAEHAFRLFDKDENTDVTKQEIEAALLNILRAKKAIEAGLRDLGVTVAKLDDMLSIIALLVAIFVWCGLFGVSLQGFLLTASSLLISFAFVVGETAKGVFQSILFLFVNHPFDVGDRISMDGVIYTVKEMGMMTTILQSIDGLGL